MRPVIVLTLRAVPPHDDERSLEAAASMLLRGPGEPGAPFGLASRIVTPFCTLEAEAVEVVRRD